MSANAQTWAWAGVTLLWMGSMYCFIRYRLAKSRAAQAARAKAIAEAP